jgi:hypothetical protein
MHLCCSPFQFILSLTDHCDDRAPERAEYRKLVDKSVVDLVVKFPQVLKRFTRFLDKFSKVTKVHAHPQSDNITRWGDITPIA